MNKIKTIGLLGTGVIGAGWAARALHTGINVVASDIDPKMEDWINEAVENALPSLRSLTEGISLPSKGKLTFTTDPISMSQQVDFIQENIPEVLDIKRKSLKSIAEVTNKETIISSSTSGFMPTELQQGMTFPERFIVGHPFNPVYLCPLVEIVGGKETSDKVKNIAKNFYEAMGMHTLMLRKEVPGHISDRLQEAMWREILHALNDDIATTGELDESIVYGPGLRWSIMGMNQIYMIAGGKGGARHFIEQFGPALKWPWSHLKAPELSNEIIDRFVEGVEAQSQGKSIREMEKIRDECLVAIQKVLSKHNMGAGKTLNEFKKKIESINKKS
ncbi:3-hydroxyacyl-CoA dehydrogenase NAD-binding domain-containing protein [Alphaproteobacteria bacterium]|nr:3-hydroxyacyl-CoA dehydrogenase NAD-binding domain-containing protein [Alphaproteobacteria bacterium]